MSLPLVVVVHQSLVLEKWRRRATFVAKLRKGATSLGLTRCSLQSPGVLPSLEKRSELKNLNEFVNHLAIFGYDQRGHAKIPTPRGYGVVLGVLRRAHVTTAHAFVADKLAPLRH